MSSAATATRWRAANEGHLSLAQRRVMTAIEICRTAALGGHVERCEDCAHTRIAYNSCRNRHCPKCQWRAAQAWLEAREAELLPVPYFHVVFTLPAAIGAIAYQNKAKVYGLLFKAAAETLTTIAADPKHLGADIGVTAVLHTWGQNLDHHPHVHCIVPGGGISPDGERWVPCRPNFFLPVRVLSRLFRRLFLEGLEALHASGRAAVLQRSRRAQRRGCVQRLPRSPAPQRVGRLRQASVRRASAGPCLSRSLHPSRRHQQQPAARHSTTSMSASAGRTIVRTAAKTKVMTPRRRRVHAPLPAARPARWLPSHSSLRPVRQRPSRREARAVSKAARCRFPPSSNEQRDDGDQQRRHHRLARAVAVA